MPQGISSTPEEYQRRLNEALAGLNGVEVLQATFCVMAVEKIFEDALKDHDSNLLNLLDRARSIFEVKQEEVEVEAGPSHLHGPFVHI